MLPIKLIGIDHSHGLESLRSNLIVALESLGLKANITEITDVDEIISLDIYGIPALMIDGQVLFQKEVPTTEAIYKALEAHIGKTPTPE